MVALNTSTFNKPLKIILVATIVVFFAATYLFANIWLNSGVDSKYRANPAAAIHIRANGDVTGNLLNASNSIMRDGETYTLTADLDCELYIDRSNIVLDGNGYCMSNEKSASNYQVLAIVEVSNVTIKNLTLKSHYNAISFLHSHNCTVQNVTGPTIYLYDSADNTITNSTAAFEFRRAQHNTVIYCRAGGFKFEDSDFNSILYSNCLSPGRSLSFMDSSSNLIFGNTFETYWWINTYGGSTKNAFVANNVTMHLYYFADSLVGTNHFFRNNFLSFVWNHTATDNSVNVWSAGGRGNYWGGYNGVDVNRDGVGDTPYVIDQNNRDQSPLMAPVDIYAEPMPTVLP